MILPIVLYGSKILRNKAHDIDAEDNFTELAANMALTLKKQQGYGLAGPQVAALKNIFVIDTTSLNEDATVPEVRMYLNPEILDYSKEELYYNEGCLSIPGIFEDVIRPDKIEVRYRNENFDVREVTLDGLVARIFQHEYDHLQGILFIDRLSSLRKRMIKSKLKQVARRSI
ncbi:peptide deformylase [Draconibacterium orientale]|uniref:peptide deformylase n=1 Tax=Draconibacterium orientale TaxID=1168034 RepID=UPI002A0A6746|nr:peptide deformylase [Draconibacterium orientale]